MKEKKYLLGDCFHYYYLKSQSENERERERRKLNGSTLKEDDNLTKNIIRYNNYFLNEKGQPPIGFGFRLGYYAMMKYYLIRPIIAREINKETGKLELPCELKEGLQFQCVRDIFRLNMEDVAYIYDEDNLKFFAISREELKAYSIPFLSDGGKISPFVIWYYKKNFWNEQLDILFNNLDVPLEYQLDFMPLLAYLKEFISLQADFVHSLFISNIINILNDAKEMLKSEMLDEDKQGLLRQTKEVLEKLKNSINDVSPYEYNKVKTLQTCIEEHEEAIRIKAEEERQRELEVLQENVKHIKRYAETLTAKSELLDYFNGK